MAAGAPARRGALRLVVDAPAAPAWNMAVDAALLESAGPPTLRCYGWSPHAVSLGYFQRAADFADIVADGVPLVRRSTGGGAIHHGDELTFSLALDAALLPGDVADSYTRLHQALADALADCGVRSHRNREGAAQSGRPAHRWCFADPVVDDLVTERGKLCGSAQRRVRTPRPRVLHHGSLVLRRPAYTPFVAAVEDQRPVDDALRALLVERIARAFAELLGLGLERGAITDGERALAAVLQADRYGSDAFTQRR